MTRDEAVEDAIHRLRSLSNAYPEDIFPPFSREDTLIHSSIITRASAAMGRHFAKVLSEIADNLESSVNGTR